MERVGRTTTGAAGGSVGDRGVNDDGRKAEGEDREGSASPADEQPVTLWIAALREGDERAAESIWEAFFRRLIQVARPRLGGLRRVRDEEDVAVSVFDSLFQGIAEGRFDELTDRDDLWRLLMRLTAQKSVDLVRHETRRKRGGGQVRGHSLFESDDLQAGFDQFVGPGKTPEFLALLEEQHQQLLNSLRDDTLRDIAQQRMMGASNQEIAEQLGISLRSVERKLNVIRMQWTRELQQ